MANSPGTARAWVLLAVIAMIEDMRCGRDTEKQADDALKVLNKALDNYEKAVREDVRSG